jgi:hypothetical protein
MKRITAVTLFAFASILGAGTALAQHRAVQATVPFDFTVGGKLLPSGTYTIAQVSSNIIEIRNQEKHAAVFSPTAADSNESRNGGKLVFNRYGGQYFLREILCESASMNMRLPATKGEKRASMEEAQVRNGAGQTLVAAK